MRSVGLPARKGHGHRLGRFNQTAAAEYGLWVNAEGKRFVNELANRKVRADAIMVEQANGKNCFATCNEPNVQPLKKQRPGFLEKMLERKIVEKYDSLEALAKAAGIKADALKAQVEEFNKVVQSKADPVWNRYINNDQVPLVDGPWYVCELRPRSITAGAASSRTTTAKCSTCAPTSRSAISMPPAKLRAACTAPFVWDPSPFSTASSSAASPVRRSLPSSKGLKKP